MTSRSAVEKAIDTHYTPGLHAWGRATQGHIGAVIQNALGAVEYWCTPNNGDHGELIIHAPQPVTGWADNPIFHCPIAGGLCFEGHSATAYTELVFPLLLAGDGRGVLRLLRDTHDHYFRVAS
ncbi:hypothetical protein ACIOD2_32200 [Amycolatopsis sp. NPDC088138]|uniref:hypothetical protein n=1 Tax=Amycolatopsis sp. NPDC088138 TaxID=3363938 RepID=UPI0037F72FA9